MALLQKVGHWMGGPWGLYPALTFLSLLCMTSCLLCCEMFQPTLATVVDQSLCPYELTKLFATISLKQTLPPFKLFVLGSLSQPWTLD